MKKNAVKEYFQKFGDVEEVILIKKATNISGFVQFVSATSAASVLHVSKHHIGKNSIKVSAADSWHQPITPVENKIDVPGLLLKREIVTTKSSLTKELHDLNDYCLMELFDYLNVIDLGAMAQTCVRFQYIAQNVFRTKHGKLDFDDVVLIKTDDSQMPLTLYKTRNILKSFGQYINTINISAQQFLTKDKGRITDMVLRFCPNLQSLRLHAFFFTRTNLIAFNNLFSKLTDLTLDECDIAGDSRMQRLMEKCKNLVSLKLASVGQLCDLCIDVVYPRLESLTVASLYTDEDLLYNFFEKHPNLKTLKVIRWGYLSDAVLPKIATHLKKLESLSITLNGFDAFVQNVDWLLQLDHLRELKFNCSLYSIAGFVAKLSAQNTIETLHITDGLLNEQLIDALCDCKRLKSLKLSSMPNVHNRFLEKLGKNLPELTEFHLTRCQTINGDGLVDLIRHAKKLERIYMSKTTIIINDDTFLTIVELCRNREPLTILDVRCGGFVSNSHNVSRGLAIEYGDIVKFVTLKESEWDDMEDDDSLDDDSDCYDSDDDLQWGNMGSDDEYLFNNIYDNDFGLWNYFDNINFYFS